MVQYNRFLTTLLGRQKILFGIIMFAFIACNNDEEEVTAPLAITRISPESAAFGEIVSVYGKGFSSKPSNNLVFFDGIKASVKEVIDDSVIQVVVPSKVTSGAIEIRVGTQRAFSNLFLVAPNSIAPVLNNLSAASLEVGRALTIVGSHFSSEPNKNVVRVGGVRAPVISATESSITVAIPGLPNGENKQVTVTVSGNISNSLSLHVTGYPGKLFYGPVYKYTSSFDATASIISVNADGSSRAVERNIRQLPSDFWIKDNGIFSLSFAMNKQSDDLLYSTFKYDKSGSFKTYNFGSVDTERWNNFTTLYSYTENEPDQFLSHYTPVFLIDHSYSNRFFVVANNNQGTGTGVLLSGSPLGEGTLTLLDNMRDLSQSNLFAASEINFYSNNYLNFKNILYRTSLVDGSTESIVLPATKQVIAFSFNDTDQSLYLLTLEEAIRQDLSRKVGVYKVQDNALEVEKITEFEFHSDIRNLALLNAHSGVKLLWRSNLSVDNITASIWMLNLVEQESYYPVLLYQNPLFISGGLPSSSGLGFDFLIVDEN